MTTEELWWDDDVNKANGTTNRTVGNTGSTTTIKVDAKNVVSRDIPDVDDNATLPSLQTKTDEMEEEGNTTIKDMLNTPPPVRRTIVNDESTISSSFTMDTCMDAMESNMITTNIHIGNLDMSVNYMNHMLAKLMKEMKQGTNDPASVSNNADESKLTQKNDSNTVSKDTILGNQPK